MAGKVDIARGSGVKLLRVDHSQVYLENERLTEDLISNLDTIQRFAYRQLMSRQAEIQELKKSSGFSLHNNNTHHSNNNSKNSNNMSGHERHHSSKHINAVHAKLQNDQQKQASYMGQDKSERTDTINGGQHITQPSRTSATSMKMTNGRFMGPNQNTNNNKNSSNDSETTTTDTSDRLYDSSYDSDDESYSTVDGRSRVRRQGITQGPRQTRSSKVSSTRNPRLESSDGKTKEQKYPSHWYTSVIPASDVTIRYRARSAKPPVPKVRAKAQRPKTSIGTSKPIRMSNIENPLLSKSAKVSGRASPPPPVPTVSTLLCHSNPTMKTRRQLMDIATQESKAALEEMTHSPIQRRLQASCDERKVIDDRVKTFLKSLEEIKKAKEKRMYCDI